MHKKQYSQYTGEKCAVCEEPPQYVYNRRALESKRVSLCHKCYNVLLKQYTVIVCSKTELRRKWYAAAEAAASATLL